MVFGCGIDIEEHGRFAKYFEPHPPENYFKSIYTANEIENYTRYNSHLCYAISFSCKEAFFKAFGISWTNSEIDWQDIELLFQSPPEKGLAQVNFGGHAKKMAQANNILIPPYFEYTLLGAIIIFEAILLCP